MSWAVAPQWTFDLRVDAQDRKCCKAALSHNTHVLTSVRQRAGYLTKWHSRRAWILDMDPPSRAATVMVTEQPYPLPRAPWSFAAIMPPLLCKRASSVAVLF